MGALTVTILICAAAMPPRDCTADTAVAVVRPSPVLYAEYSGYTGCLSFGERFAASLHYVESGRAWPKIRCTVGALPGSVG